MRVSLKHLLKSYLEINNQIIANNNQITMRLTKERKHFKILSKIYASWASKMQKCQLFRRLNLIKSLTQIQVENREEFCESLS